MNLYMLIQVIPMRIDNLNMREQSKKKPIIKIYDKENNREIDFDNGFFDKSSNLLLDLRLFSNIWNDLLPDDGQTIEEKHFEIAEFLGGHIYARDVLILMKWLSKRADVDICELDWLIETSDCM